MKKNKFMVIKINMHQRKDTSVKKKKKKTQTKLRDSYGSYLTEEEIKERKLTLLMDLVS